MQPPFEKFNSQEDAQEMLDLLLTHGIHATIEQGGKYFDPTFANISRQPEFLLMLNQNDFSLAQKILQDNYAQQYPNLSREYYLFSFTDSELLDILAKPDEWSIADHTWAQILLSERGKTIKPEEVSRQSEKRIREISKTERVNPLLISAGYLVSATGGLLYLFYSSFGLAASLFGIGVGIALRYRTKTLPDGQTLFVYDERDREHGNRILIIALLSAVISLVAFFYFATSRF
ncbi:MAG: hypothetical protein JNJ58_06065 [Chitinophagaceae bacterium]|nr:hypothetical protein [Chitinophagaceae bacterium]